jgi:hypothetical protein
MGACGWNLGLLCGVPNIADSAATIANKLCATLLNSFLLSFR